MRGQGCTRHTARTMRTADRVSSFERAEQSSRLLAAIPAVMTLSERLESLLGVAWPAETNQRNGPAVPRLEREASLCPCGSQVAIPTFQGQGVVSLYEVQGVRLAVKRIEIG